MAGADRIGDSWRRRTAGEGRVDEPERLPAQAAQGARDPELAELTGRCEPETSTQLRWLLTPMKQAAPQALLVAD